MWIVGAAALEHTRNGRRSSGRRDHRASMDRAAIVPMGLELLVYLVASELGIFVGGT